MLAAPVHPRSSHQWWQRAKINSRKGGSIQTETASFVLKDFGRGVLKNYAICGFFSPSTACAVHDASPTSITSANAASWPCNQSCPARPGAAEWAHRLLLPSAALTPNLAPQSETPAPGTGWWQDSQSRDTLQWGQTPTFAFFWACQSWMEAAVSHEHLSTAVPSWDKPPMGMGTRGDRAGLSLFLGNANGVLWCVHETSEDVFSALPGMTRKGCREYPNTVQGTQPCSNSYLLPQEKSLHEMAPKKFCLCEMSWNLLRFTVAPSCQPHPSENAHFPARTFCLHGLGLCWPQAAPGVQCLSHCPAVPKTSLSKCIYIMLQLWMIPLGLIAKVLGQ